MNTGWKKIIINSNSDLRKSSGFLIIKKDDAEIKVPLHEINALIIETTQATFSSALINSLIENEIRIIFCDKKHNPSHEVVSYSSNTYFPERLGGQIEWENTNKNNIWSEIIKLKVSNQASLLKKFNIEEYSRLEDIEKEIDDESANSCEAVAAKIYFRSIFGSFFNRRTESNINAALNYGYSIILSEVNRAVASHGYSTSIGINHHSSKNPFNFSCDLMEPFRPFVDEIICINGDRELDREYKSKLIKVTEKEIRYNGVVTTISDAIDRFVCRITDCLNRGISTDEEIGFAC